MRPLALFIAGISILCAQTPPNFDRLTKEADAARAANRPDQAATLYKKALAIKPTWEEGWWNLGTIYYGLDQYPQGRDAFLHLSKLAPNVATTWAMLGLCEFNTKQYDDAIRHLGHGIQLGVEGDPEVSDVAHYHFAMLLTRYQQYEEAIRILVTFAQRHLSQPAYVEALGIACLRKPLLPSELPPTEREIVMDTGRAMYDASELKAAEAEADFKSLMDKYSTQPNIHYLYATYLLSSNPDGAIVEFKKELEISPAHLPATISLAAEYLRRHEFKSALPYAEQAVKLDPRSFTGHLALGRILSEGELDATRGLTELELARKQEPNSPQVRVALATAYAHAGRKDDAARERQAFLKLKEQGKSAKPEQQ